MNIRSRIQLRVKIKSSVGRRSWASHRRDVKRQMRQDLARQHPLPSSRLSKTTWWPGPCTRCGTWELINSPLLTLATQQRRLYYLVASIPESRIVADQKSKACAESLGRHQCPNALSGVKARVTARRSEFPKAPNRGRPCLSITKVRNACGLNVRALGLGCT